MTGTVHIQDRRRVAALVEQEFQTRINEAQKEPIDTEIQNEIEEIVRSEKLQAKIKKLNALRDQVAAIEKELSIALDWVLNHSGKPKTKRSSRQSNCECHDDYESILVQIAKAKIEKARKQGNDPESLRKQKRKLLARIEVAKSSVDLNAVLKTAGLL